MLDKKGFNTHYTGCVAGAARRGSPITSIHEGLFDEAQRAPRKAEATGLVGAEKGGFSTNHVLHAATAVSKASGYRNLDRHKLLLEASGRQCLRI
jgi:hypothetical protein